jgi:hypothetical protein
MKKRLYITQQARNYYQICYHSIESWDRFHLNGTLDALTNKNSCKRTCKQESRNVAND